MCRKDVYKQFEIRTGVILPDDMLLCKGEQLFSGTGGRGKMPWFSMRKGLLIRGIDMAQCLP